MLNNRYLTDAQITEIVRKTAPYSFNAMTGAISQTASDHTLKVIAEHFEHLLENQLYISAGDIRALKGLIKTGGKK